MPGGGLGPHPVRQCSYSMKAALGEPIIVVVVVLVVVVVVVVPNATCQSSENT